jgi:Mg2+/Co2+ transporter CorB
VLAVGCLSAKIEKNLCAIFQQKMPLAAEGLAVVLRRLVGAIFWLLTALKRTIWRLVRCGHRSSTGAGENVGELPFVVASLDRRRFSFSNNQREEEGGRFNSSQFSAGGRESQGFPSFFGFWKIHDLVIFFNSYFL